MQNHERNILSDIIHFYSLFYRPEFIRPNADYEFVTPMGAFRIAYLPQLGASPNSMQWGAQALFYARHVDDLAAEYVKDDRYAGGYRLKIKHPERLYVLEIKNRRFSSGAEFVHDDSRAHLDCSSLLKVIYDAAQYISRIQLREANLHGVGGSYRSAYMGFHPTKPDKNGKSEIDITTRINTDFGFHTATPSQMRKIEWRLAVKALQRLSTTLNLSVPIVSAEGAIEWLNQFYAHQIIPAILQDSQGRIEAVLEGIDPSLHQKTYILGPRRAAEMANARAHEARNVLSAYQSLIPAATKYGIKLMHFPWSLLEFAVDEMFAPPEISDRIPGNWHHAIKKRRRMISVVSGMQEFMMLPNPEAFADFEWLHPQKHLPHFAVNKTLSPSSQESNFQNWLISNFIAPYCSVSDYYGTFGAEGSDDFAAMRNMAEVRLIRGETNHGLQMFYDTRAMKLYTHYNRGAFDPFRRLLPRGADEYFTDDNVLVCEMADFAAPMQTISSRQFEATMGSFDIAPEKLRLKPARKPPPDALNRPDGAILPHRDRGLALAQA